MRPSSCARALDQPAGCCSMAATSHSNSDCATRRVPHPRYRFRNASRVVAMSEAEVCPFARKGDGDSPAQARQSASVMSAVRPSRRSTSAISVFAVVDHSLEVSNGRSGREPPPPAFVRLDVFPSERCRCRTGGSGG